MTPMYNSPNTVFQIFDFDKLSLKTLFITEFIDAYSFIYIPSRTIILFNNNTGVYSCSLEGRFKLVVNNQRCILLLDNENDFYFCIGKHSFRSNTNTVDNIFSLKIDLGFDARADIDTSQKRLFLGVGRTIKSVDYDNKNEKIFDTIPIGVQFVINSKDSLLYYFSQGGLYQISNVNGTGKHRVGTIGDWEFDSPVYFDGSIYFGIRRSEQFFHFNIKTNDTIGIHTNISSRHLSQVLRLVPRKLLNSPGSSSVFKHRNIFQR